MTIDGEVESEDTFVVPLGCFHMRSELYIHDMLSI
jgi:hypothetical protein